MKTLNPYLTLNGRCREALDFYKRCLGGEVVASTTFADAKMEVPPGHEQDVMHSEFRSEGIHFMAADGMPGKPSEVGKNIALALGFDTETEQTKAYEALVEGGDASMPLHDAFWGARFGMLTDKFGIQWMLNCDKK
jgi:PhnB protein